VRQRSVVVTAAQVPFHRGGAEWHVGALHAELLVRGFAAEVVQLPFQWEPRLEVLKSCLAWRLLDFTHANGIPIDLVIGTKFPSYVAAHPNKVVWLTHQFRQAYDLHDAGLEGFPKTPEGRALRQQIVILDTRALSESRRIFAISQNVANRLKTYNNLDATILPIPLRNKDVYCCTGWNCYILSVGRLDPLKRTDMLIRAVPYLPSAYSVVIVGEGAQREELAELAEGLNVNDRVRFMGRVDSDELNMLYANCSAVYYAPYDEDYGLVTLEAFQSRKPVVTTDDSGGVLELVHNGETGLVAPNDPARIAACLTRLLQNDALARRLGQAGYELIQPFQWDLVIEQLTAERT
jgi:glycosyltransferase involved in cell wall biosynthesis